MQRVATVRWRSPAPTSVDEELAAYDDGTVWLAVRGSREGAPSIGTWSVTPSAEDHAALVAVGDLDVDLLHAQVVPEVVERVRTAALAAPVATAQFIAAPGGGDAVTLAAVAVGSRPVRFEVEPDSLTVHLERDGATLAWYETARPATGFITQDASGLGGIGRRAEIPPGSFGAIPLHADGIDGAPGEEVAVQLAGWLAEGLPDQPLPLPFRARTAATAR
jgi:hypothetical protein